MVTRNCRRPNSAFPGGYGLLSVAAIAAVLASREPASRTTPAESDERPCPVANAPDRDHRFLWADPTTPLADYAVEHYHGDGLGMNRRLCILPDGQYSFIETGCLGVYERESGYARIVDGRWILSPVVSTRPKMPREFVPIRWGSRSYLIPPVETQGFCDAIIDGYEPRDDIHGIFYLSGDPARPVAGIPEMPNTWASYLRKNLLAGLVEKETPDGCVTIGLDLKGDFKVGDVLLVRTVDAGVIMVLEVKSVAGKCLVARGGPNSKDEPLGVGKAVTVSRSRSLSPP